MPLQKKRRDMRGALLILGLQYEALAPDDRVGRRGWRHAALVSAIRLDPLITTLWALVLFGDHGSQPVGNLGDHVVLSHQVAHALW